MTVTGEMIHDLRLMVVEPTTTVYPDQKLIEKIEASALPDVEGHLPTDTDWIATYNIFKVASEIWLEKAAAVADEFDFDADGGKFSRSQKHMMYLKQASVYISRSKAFSLALVQRPVTNLSGFGYQDTPYKDWLDEYEQNLE